PVWLAPVQVAIIPIADRHLEYAFQVEAELKGSGMRAQVDTRSERMNLKIREAQLDKIPYMLIVGDKEMEAAMVSVRLRSGEDLGRQSVEAFKAMATEAIAERKP
ncbi:MAG: threonine--tRNA ligase, partial [Dehalococcoidia bacterium]|nr:threonine--tRNA ligase [Dehalococcoidia bacterium]